MALSENAHVLPWSGVYLHISCGQVCCEEYLCEALCAFHNT